MNFAAYRLITMLVGLILGGCSEQKAGLTESIEAISRYNSDPIRVTGTASIVRIGTRLNDPNDRAVIDPVNTRDRAIKLPDIFGRYSAQDRLKTKRMATADAYRKLTAAVYDLKVSKTQTLRDRVEASGLARLEMELKHQTVQPARYLEDGTVQVDVLLSLDDAVNLLEQNMDLH